MVNVAPPLTSPVKVSAFQLGAGAVASCGAAGQERRLGGAGIWEPFQRTGASAPRGTSQTHEAGIRGSDPGPTFLKFPDVPADHRGPPGGGGEHLRPIVKVTERRPARPVASGAAEPTFLRSPDIPEADPSRDQRVSGEVSSDWAEPPPQSAAAGPQAASGDGCHGDVPTERTRLTTVRS